MRLLSLVLYDHQGRSRVIRFRRGLNVVTGNSATGKSALLDMVEYCLGRNTLTTPIGPIRDTVAWYGLLIDLGNQRAFVARPAPSAGNATTQQAMLEFGVNLEPPVFGRLIVNADTTAIRDQIGRSIGIDENITNSTGLRPGYEANLGHAVLFCLQRQSEIANREFLFHRQGEEGIARAIQDVLPYFVGAVPKDRAILRQQLLEARRDLRSAEAELRLAEVADREYEITLEALLMQARTAGLLPDESIAGTAAGLAALQVAVNAVVSEVTLDDVEAQERERLVRRRDELRVRLHQLGQQRATLEALGSDESAYENVVSQQGFRLRSLDLLGDDIGHSADVCPVCNSPLAEPDPTIAELRAAAEQLQAQAGNFARYRPRRLQATEEVSANANEVRNEIRTIDEAIDALEASRRQVTSGRRFAERQAFLQGRIQRYLETAPNDGGAELSRLQERVRVRSLGVEELENLLDEDEEREQLTSRLLLIGADMTRWADRLRLEHSGEGVRLDARKLTVVTDTPSGPTPLNQIGSAANWIGYHVIAHLALHKFFVTQARPVPHFLMLDQPTQAYYPSDVTQRQAGVPVTDADREAVRALFRLMVDVTSEIGDELQIIVCDHANLTEDWFQEAVIENWRDGRRLIPDEWISSN